MNADQWNARYPIATRVMAYPSVRPKNSLAVAYQERAAAGRLLGKRDTDPCRRLNTVTRSVAWTLGHGAPVVLVEGETGGISLDHVDPAPPTVAPMRSVQPCGHDFRVMPGQTVVEVHQP